MTERGPQPEQQRFQSPRDELLHIMANEGWADETAGDLDSRTGLFSRVTNEPDDLLSLDDAFTDDIDNSDIESIQELRGHFLIIDKDDVVTVETFEDKQSLIAEFRIRQQVFESEGTQPTPNNPNGLSVTQVAAYELEKQVAAGAVAPADRTYLLGRLGTSFVPKHPEGKSES